MPILRPNEHLAEVHGVQVSCVLTCDCGLSPPMLLIFQPRPKPDRVNCTGCGMTYYLAELHLNLNQGELRVAIGGDPAPLVRAAFNGGKSS